nr:cytochrome B6-f complex subunit [Pulvinaster venetus]UNJ17021.1 cytochrome B6-f complex subunit [Pulvinaster venetus]
MGSEITSVAIICFFLTLIGISLGFVLLKIQGE